MSFAQTLNAYIDAVGCSGGDLARESGLSTASISRYRSGSRIPDLRGSQIPAIADALVRLSHNAADPLDGAVVMRNLMTAAGGGPEVENTNRLLEVLGVSNSNLARELPFDPSFLWRVRSGRSRPIDARAYVEGALRYIATHCTSSEELRAAGMLMAVDASQLADARDYLEALYAWVRVAHAAQADPTETFFARLDAFDPNEYLRLMYFDEVKLPPRLPHMPTTRVYRGLHDLRQAELDFFRVLVTSRNASTLFMYNDMPMEDMAKNLEFGKQWMVGVAAALKRGIRLRMLHNVDRPYREMMLGLESWIPLYMTGQVLPFYLPGHRDGHFMHTLYVSEPIALMGEGIAGHHDDACYRVTLRKNDLAYAEERARQLLGHARPLMDIYRLENAADYSSFASKESGSLRPCRRMLSSPPLFTLPTDMLNAMLAREGIRDSEAARIREHAASERVGIEGFLTAGGILSDMVADLSEDELAARPMHLALSDLFCPRLIPYTHDEYQRHLHTTIEFAQTQATYSFATEPDLPFRNLRITLVEGSVAVVSKGGSPCIHFVIHHPLLRAALEHMVVSFVFPDVHCTAGNAPV